MRNLRSVEIMEWRSLRAGLTTPLRLLVYSVGLRDQAFGLEFHLVPTPGVHRDPRTSTLLPAMAVGVY